jgi:NAD(P)-dependent dehydrogenase (short-subunit alcohol dehydrogenase family)
MQPAAYVITGPTSGYGHRAALALARHAPVVLVGRDRGKLDRVRAQIERRGGTATCVVCDVADLTSVRRAAAAIVALGQPLAGILNNAGIAGTGAEPSPQGWDKTFATNHLGPFALTEALVPHLPDGANVVFVASAVEDPARKPATLAGFRGGRFVSVAASARGEWQPGGSKLKGGDAYATSKQCVLAAALALARATPRIRVNAIEPGFSPTTNLGRDAHLALRILAKTVFALIVPLVKYGTTPRRAGRVLAGAVLEPTATGVYFDERGKPMQPSARVRDPAFQDRVLAETRAFLAAAA